MKPEIKQAWVTPSDESTHPALPSWKTGHGGVSDDGGDQEPSDQAASLDQDKWSDVFDDWSTSEPPYKTPLHSSGEVSRHESASSLSLSVPETARDRASGGGSPISRSKCKLINRCLTRFVCGCLVFLEGKRQLDTLKHLSRLAVCY